jgi:hypothetical protein
MGDTERKKDRKEERIIISFSFRLPLSFRSLSSFAHNRCQRILLSYRNAITFQAFGMISRFFFLSRFSLL